MTQDHTTTIAVISDTHFWPGSEVCFGTEEEQLQPWSEEIHAAFLEEMRRVAPDLLIHLGDFSCGGGVFHMPEAEFRTTITEMERDYRELPLRFYAVPGNHDCPHGATDYAFAEKLFGLRPRMGRTIDLEHARLVLLNAQGHSPAQMRAALPNDPTYGWVDESELSRLDQALAEAGSRPVLILTHQLLHRWSNPYPWTDFYGIRNADAVLEIIARHGNVRAVIQGHAHILDAQEVMIGGRPVHFIINPALIQYPLGWLHLALSSEVLEIRYHPLPLPALSERSRTAGKGSDWRCNPNAAKPFQVMLG